MEENQKVRALLVAIQTPEDDTFAYAMKELQNLAEADGFETVGEIVQKQAQIQRTHYLGKGKVEEVIEAIATLDVDALIFNDELTPSQFRNLDEEIPCTVLDRTMLILDIFASRAKTKEAKLQVEISTLQYQLPRLAGMYENLGRQGGGVGFYNRGGGESKLELDRRQIEERIRKKRKDLQKMVVERQVQRKQRQRSVAKTVALVGYTNAGKSSLMNVLVDDQKKQVFVKDMLFATLETRVRVVTLAEGKTCLLSDTVGFVSKLPHHLIQAFRSTLEEVKEADLLLHVIDSSNAYYHEQMETTLATLKAIGIEQIPMIEVYNKIDLSGIKAQSNKQKVYLSATTKTGVEDLKAAMVDSLFQDDETWTLLLPYAMGNVVSMLKEMYEVRQLEYEEEGIRLSVVAPGQVLKRYQQYRVQ